MELHMNTENILEILYIAVEDINDTLKKDEKIECSASTSLIHFDSLSQLNFVIEVERLLEKRLDKTIILFDASVTDENQSALNPFQSIAIFSQYVAGIIAD